MENFQNLQQIEEEKRKTAEAEAKEKILSGALSFAREVIQQYPQLNENNQLNYYFSGSLATMLLLKTDEFETLDESKLPEIETLSTRKFSPEFHSKLKPFVRKIGDLDFVRLEGWEKSAKVMRKGGGGPQLSELSDTAKNALDLKEDQFSIFCDPLTTYTAHQVARVNIENQDFYITAPKMILAYKILHLTQSFDNENKTNKFLNDFNVLLESIETIYSREELLLATHDLIFAYGKNDPNNTFIPYHNLKFSGALKTFLDEIIASDPDVVYLEQLEYAKERSVGILKILHHYQSPEAKKMIIDFINKHRERIDQWSINSSSVKSRELMADFLLANPEPLERLKKYLDKDKEMTKELIVESLKNHPWVFLEYGDELENKKDFVMTVRSSNLMDVLIHLNEDNLSEELSNLDVFLANDFPEFDLSRLFNEKIMMNLEIRKLIFLSLKKASNQIQKENLDKFFYQLRQLIYNTFRMDKPLEIREEEIKKGIIAIFETWSVKL